MPKRRMKNDEAEAGDSARRTSSRLKDRAAPAPVVTAEPKQKIKKAPAKPKKAKEVEKPKPEEEAEAPAENGEAKDEAPSTDEDKKKEDAE
ncbi:non-histone chromosomal protein HMG-like [Gadus morhua]|uniref:non-histone chromosomal protein HMG-like n=1 Tax=Gadus morhua TaxID=8049 RepID=UPI0011B47DAE|nr:non-histone chromosomal protein HMG-17-like [Gadus morhua]XP_056450436.1 non-histone chromosomal protein HMG-like [Gadus chalcogrammus]XP_059913243.1 non-histone chromosomal protein HMG-like [Gadus macrocephalus]